MKEKFLKYEDIKKDFPIISESQGDISYDRLDYVNKQLAENLSQNYDFSESRLKNNAQKNMQELGLDYQNYERFLSGISLFDKENYLEASDIFKEILIFYPENIYILTELGDIYYNIQDYENSNIFYNKILEINPTDFNSLHKLGTTYYGFSQYDKALKFYKLIQQYHPDFEDINIYLGYTYNQLGDYTNAISYLEIAKTFNNKNPLLEANILEGLGDGYFSLGNYIISEKMFLDSFQKYPQNQKILLKIAQSNMSSNDFSKAIQYINLSIESHGADFDSIYNLGICYYSLGDYETALKYFDSLSQNSPEDIDSLIYKIRCIHMIHGKKFALDYTIKALESDSNNEDLYAVLEYINNS